MTMEFGCTIFFTDYSITPAELAIAMEERGLDSVWVAEHTHIPVPRKTPPPGGGELQKRYYDVMDPFVTLAVCGAVTKKLKLATGICLVIQRDTISTAKSVASLDQVSGGRFIFGIGGGWNVEEVESHGTPFATRMLHMREQIEAMKEIGPRATAEYTGETVKVVPTMTWPKPVQKPTRPSSSAALTLGRAARGALWRRLVSQCIFRKPGRNPAGVEEDGRRCRPAAIAGDDGRLPPRSRQDQAPARPRRGGGQHRADVRTARPIRRCQTWAEASAR